MRTGLQEDTRIEHDIHAAQEREVKMVVFNFMKEMPPSLRNACMEFIREKAKTEQSTAAG